MKPYYDSVASNPVSTPFGVTVYHPGGLALGTVLGIPSFISAALARENWKAIGDAKRVSQGGIWVGVNVSDVLLFFGLAAVGLPLGNISAAIICLGTFLTWYCQQVKPQSKVLKELKDSSNAPHIRVKCNQLVGFWILGIFSILSISVGIQAITPLDAVPIESYMVMNDLQRDLIRYRNGMQAVIAAEQVNNNAVKDTLTNLAPSGVSASRLVNEVIPAVTACLRLSENLKSRNPNISRMHESYVGAIRTRLEAFQLFAAANRGDKSATQAALDAKFAESKKLGDDFNRSFASLSK